MARRILNRKDMRADFEAAERRKQDQEENDELEEQDDDDKPDEEVAVDQTESDESDEDGEEEEAPKYRKAAKPAKPRARRAAKITRMKVVWGVFNNSNQRVAVFDYPQRQEANDMVAKLRAEKKSTFFVQPVKEPIEQKTHP